MGAMDCSGLHQVMRRCFDTSGLVRVVPHIAKQRAGMQSRGVDKRCMMARMLDQHFWRLGCGQFEDVLAEPEDQSHSNQPAD